MNLWYIISYSFNFCWVFKGCFNKHGYNFDDAAKMATVGLVKINVFWNKGYDFIIFVNDITNKILSCDSNYIVDVVTWQRFGNPMREAIITSNL